VRPITEADAAFIRSRLIYEDSAVLAFDKPAGLSSQGGRIDAATLDDLLAAFAKPNGKRPRLVHRLDRDTSGVILVAKTQPAAAFLGKALMGRRVRKTYLAIVGPGAPAPRDGRIETPLRRVAIGREAHMGVCAPGHPEAEAASTGYRTLAATDEAALLELRPQTGRMHQLRVHMASIARPIAGDPRYGGALALAGGSVPRLMLHAASIRFPHPEGGERTIVAPTALDVAAVLARLGLEVPEAATVEAARV
jgi:tRNA pseudouridine32 synthase/23S rRNA pseudouridine746 synthase